MSFRPGRGWETNRDCREETAIQAEFRRERDEWTRTRLRNYLRMGPAEQTEILATGLLGS